MSQSTNTSLIPEGVRIHCQIGKNALNIITRKQFPIQPASQALHLAPKIYETMVWSTRHFHVSKIQTIYTCLKMFHITVDNILQQETQTLEHATK